MGQSKASFHSHFASTLVGSEQELSSPVARWLGTHAGNVPRQGALQDHAGSRVVILGGPMFESAAHGPWRSVHGKQGGHYNTFNCDYTDGMLALRTVFPDAVANIMNLCFFSTSGVHGSYLTIEECSELFRNGWVDPDDVEDGASERQVTFCIFQPRICTIRYGNCQPKTEEDFAFLMKLRATSWKAAASIGVHEETSP